MAKPSLPSGLARSREEVARIEVGHTTVSRPTAWTLVVGFLFLIGAPIVTEWVAGESADRGGAAWSQLATLPEQVRAAAGRDEGAAGTLPARIIAANRTVLAGLDTFTDTLEDEARLARILRPPAQLLLSGWPGLGNERVYPARNGWLFYRPDVEYVTGPGFLDRRQQARRTAAVNEWTEAPHTDPHAAIVRFTRQLEARGISLVLVPTPVKPTVHPEKLSHSYDGRETPLQNASYGMLMDGLRREGVLVFDPADVLARERSGAFEGLYLATDTHWRPEAMERTVELLAAFVREHVSLPVVPNPRWRVEAREVRNLGDTAVMLDLPDHQRLHPPEAVTVRRVVEQDGAPWRPSRTADVLVLGDSFSNIFSLGSLGWGDGAGLVEHLSVALQRPVDRIVQNDAGAFATRERLRQDLAAGTDRLTHVRVVVYQFAARELAFGDWKPIELPAPDR